MNHVMIDLETMSTASDAAIVSVGAVEFDPETGELGREFYAVVDLQSAIDAGLRVDGSTVMWWLKQSEAARDALADKRASTLDDAMVDFCHWIPRTGYVWSHGASFDLPILGNAMRVCGLEKPWQYNQELDTRTVLWLTDSKMPVVKGVAHNALDDARNQALGIISALKILKEKKRTKKP